MLMHPGLTLTLTHPALQMVAFDLRFAVSSKSMRNYWRQFYWIATTASKNFGPLHWPTAL